MVPGSAAELCRAHARPRRRARCGGSARPLAVARSVRPDLRRPARPGGSGARRAPAARGRPRRPGGRVPAEHPRDARRLPGRSQPRRDLGDLPARVRAAQRARPPRPARAERAARRRRLPLGRDVDRPPRAGRGGALRSAVAAQRRPRPVWRKRAPGHGPVGRARGRGRAARVRPGSVRPPALRALLVGHDRPAEGDRPRPRRHPARAPEEPRPLVGPAPRRPADVVHDHRVDDVERPRLGPPAARVDRDARRKSRVSRSLPAVAPGRGNEGDDVRAQPGVHDGLPQGGTRAGPRLRPLDAEDDLRRRLPTPGRLVRMDLRAGRAGDDAERRQRRHRRLHRTRPGLPLATGLCRRDGGQVPRRRRGRVRFRRERGRRRARRARHPATDAVDAGEVLERRGRLALPGRLLRCLPRRLAARRLDHVHRAGHLDHHGPLRRDPEPRRRPPGHERAVRRRRGVRRGARRAGRPPRSDRRAPALRRPPRRSRARRRPEERASPTRSAPDCPRATSPTTSSRCRRSRAR